ncbi:uncharacterized protein si:ch211-106e7.2 [Xyrauchen texanus]|uniref:uncharacterized protein si:ch211-106e7.2 n=1 Tax=Xyrauchen texanus TaxID=154827 RepID=UPI0022420A8D|nr:uncharacterized protein si:ch211-106e7.2 [Xyrauchen texanus]
MQADSQPPGQWQNLHGNVVTSGDWTSNNPGHILHHQCVPPHHASFPYPNQISTGNELTKFSCTILQTTSDKGLTSSTQSTENMMPPQENNFNSECTGKLNSHIIMWNMPSSNCQMFLPVNNINMQGAINVASNNYGPNMSHCALRPSSETFNSNNSSYTQQKTTSISTVPNSTRQFEANRTMDTWSLNESERNVNTRSLHSRRKHANTANNLPKQTLPNQNLPKSARKRKSSSTMKDSLPTETAPHRQSSPIGGCIYPSTLANPQTHSTCKQNNAAQKAVAVVTPLSMVEIASVDSSNKSIHNTKISVLDASSAQGTIHHYLNIPHPLANTNLKAIGESNDLTSKYPRPSSGGEQRLNDGLCYAVGARNPVWTDESTSDGNCTTLPKLHRVVTEQNESVLSTLRQANEKMPNNNRAVTDSQKTDTEETDRCSPIPVIEWSLDRLHTLIAMVQQIDDGYQKNVYKTDPGKEILKIYWNGDFCEFYNVAQTGIYLNIMEEVFFYCQKNDPVILRQIRGDKRNQVAKDFHILKHNETPPKMMPYKSSWLNLNEKLDDIDKECDFSWFYRSFHGTPQERDKHKVSNSACEMPNKLLDASAQLVAACQCQAEAVNKVPVEEQKCLELKDTKSDSESLCENMHVSLEQLQPVTDNCSTKLNVVLTEQSNSQPSIVNPLKTMTNLVKVLDKQTVPTEMSVKAILNDRFCNDVEAKSPVLFELTSQRIQTSSLMAMNNPVRLLEKNDVSLSRLQCQIGKHDILNQKHQYPTPSSEGSRLGDRFSNCAGAKSLGESSSQSDGTSSPKHNPAVINQQDLVVSSLTQNESDEKLSNRDCAVTDNCMRDETEPKDCTEVVAYKKEDDIGLDSLASLKINVLPHYIAKQCFAGEVMEDNGLQKDSAAPPEMRHKSYGLHLLNEIYKSFNDTPQIREQTVNKVLVEQTCLKLNQSLPENLPISFEQSLPVTEEVINCQPKFVNPLEAMTCMTKKLERLNVSNRKYLRQILNERVLKRKHQCSTRSSEKSRLDYHFRNCAGAKSLVLTDESSNQSDCTSAPKRNPFVAEQQEFVLSQIQTEPNEKITNTDCAGMDKSVICETEPQPSGVAVDALAFVQMNVLSHEMAEQWFTGELEDQSLEKDIAKHPSSEDQLKVLLLDTSSDTEVLIEDVKTKESNNQSTVHDELESYCCLAKWFQILQYGDGSSCKCQEKAILNEKGIEIEAHATNLEMLKNKADGSDVFSDECGPMELEYGSPETMCFEKHFRPEAKNPLMSHTNYAYVDKINIVKGNSSSEEVFEVERVMSEQTKEESPSKCATNETLKLFEVEKDPLDPDSKRHKNKTIHLSLYGSSSDVSNKVIPTRRYQVKESCQEPPETLRVILSSHQKTEEKRKSNKRKWLESLNNEDALETRRKIIEASFTTIDPSRSSPSHEITPKRVSEVFKENALSSMTKLVSPSLNPQSKVHYADGNRRKRKLNDRPKQISINKCIIRGKYMPSKSSLQSPLTVMKSKYEMGNPALMPLEEGLGLEFKVLPKSFNFTVGNELRGGQVDKSPNSKNEMSHPEDKLTRMMKTSHATQGAWCFTPLKMKHTGSNQATDVSGSGSLFQEFKKRFHDKNRENTSTNLNSK